MLISLKDDIPEMVANLTREKMRQMYKDGKLTPYGRRMAKFPHPFNRRELWRCPAR